MARCTVVACRLVRALANVVPLGRRVTTVGGEEGAGVRVRLFFFNTKTPTRVERRPKACTGLGWWALVRPGHTTSQHLWVHKIYQCWLEKFKHWPTDSVPVPWPIGHTLSLYLSLTLAPFFPTELPELFRVELTFRVWPIVMTGGWWRWGSKRRRSKKHLTPEVNCLKIAPDLFS